jgi:hypothetical protein
MSNQQEMKEAYENKQFILIKNTDITSEKMSFVKGLDMSYRNNDIYLYEASNDMTKHVELINADLANPQNANSSLSGEMTATVLSFEEMKEKHNDIMTNHYTNKKLKETYEDKIFLVITNGDNDSNEFVKGSDMSYSNNDLYVYNSDTNLGYITSGANKELQFHQSGMTAELKDFNTMKRDHKELLVNKMNGESPEVGVQQKSKATKKFKI